MVHERKDRLKKSVLVLATSWLAMLPATALASPNYPDAMLDVLQDNGSGPPCAPPCITCHRDNNGGTGTVIKPFGLKFYQLAVIAFGKPGQRSDSQARAIFRLMRDGTSSDESTKKANAVLGGKPTDTDADGISDFDELENDVSPNAGNAKLCEITYGCGARVEPHGEVSSGFSLLSSAAMVFALAGSLRWARRRASR